MMVLAFNKDMHVYLSEGRKVRETIREPNWPFLGDESGALMT